MSIVSYPLKTTQDVQLLLTFEQHITAYYGSQAWSPVKESFEKMEKIRASMDFKKINVSLASDPSTCQQLEDLILQYLQYCFVIQSKFRFEQYQQGCIAINFKWADSFDAKKSIGTTQIKYEMSSCLYNLAVIYYSYGLNLMARNQVDDRKEAIKKFRHAMWALDELKQQITGVLPEVKNTHTDFSLENISILENMSFGFVYVCLFENLFPNHKQLGGIKNVIQLAGEAAKFFGISKGMIDQILKSNLQGYPIELLRSIKAQSDFYFSFYNSLTAKEMAAYHQNLIQDEPLGNHMGWALSYLRKGDQLLKICKNDAVSMNYMPQELKDRLNNQHQYFVSELPAAEQRNAQIYKQPVKTPEELPSTQITLEKLKNLGGVKPPVLENKPPGTEAFEGFLNEEQILLIQECKSTTETRQMELNQALTQITEMKTKAYLENYVNVCLDAQQATQQSQGIPNSIKTKLDKIQSLGGVQQLKNLQTNLKEFSVNCGMMIQTCRQKLDQEAAFDDQMKQTHGQKWTRRPSYESNQEYFKKLNDYEEKFKQAQKVDQENIGKVQRISGDIEIAGKNENDIAAMLPKSGDQQFAINNQVQLAEIRQLDNNFNQEIQQIRNQISNLTNMNINYGQQVQICVQNKVPRDKVQETVLKDFFNGIEDINKQIALVSSILGNICAIAMELNSKRQGGGSQQAQQSESISSGLATVIDCFEEMQGGLNFYGQLMNRLSDSDKKINDYVYARDVEQKHIQQQIGNAVNMQNQVNQNPFGASVMGQQQNQIPIQQSPYNNQPQNQQQQGQFFNPNTNQFPVGQSFIGGNPQQQQQQQFNNNNPYAYQK